MDHVVEYLPSKYKALSLNASTANTHTHTYKLLQKLNYGSGH
jgi:hypothetical protein